MTNLVFREGNNQVNAHISDRRTHVEAAVASKVHVVQVRRFAGIYIFIGLEDLFFLLALFGRLWLRCW